MKKIALTLLVGFAIISIMNAQDENEWIYQISYEATDNCTDSVTCYNEVIVILNMEYIPDSTQLFFKIGDTPGSDNLYSRQLLKTAAIFNEQGITQDSAGNALVALGQYIVTEQFFVDMEILTE